MENRNKVKVFISYSWDSEEHQKWVVELADLICAKGGEVIVDRTHLKYGGHIKTFMLKSVLEADIVLMILTPYYKTKADNLQGGAGYEYNIINDELFKVITKNDKYIPVLRNGTSETSLTTFLQGFRYVDLREGDNYNKNLEELVDQVLKTPLKQPVEQAKNGAIMEKEYKDIGSLVLEMTRKAKDYFNLLFKAENDSFKKVKMQATLQSWENEIDDYSNEIKEIFNPTKMELYEDYLEDFKNNVFGKNLWTVNAALRTRDPDLARYKKDYRDADAEEIYITIQGILNATHQYVEKETGSINYKQLKGIDDLKMQYLNEDVMFMNKIIGYGIRSEILHRYYPSFLPVMTQKSLWAMYFICDSADEFITIEQRNRKGIMRVSHNWQYQYDRFTYLMNVLANQLKQWFDPFGLELKEEFRFGYVNMFLSTIHDSHRSDINLLHTWQEE